MDPEAFGELTLGLAVGTSECQQNCVRAGVGPYRRKPALEVAADMGAELREEKRDSFVEFSNAGVMFTRRLGQRRLLGYWTVCAATL
ncbi:hypothetical protein MINTMi198_21560 [Mycobacterium intracellulare M.i.198]|nr:hypothetical protein MINTM003_20320 [Mycobacterium paraintracellulare]BCO57036.1 hypothetical protein MINTM005_22800 [Mycobacterium intracellulare]BCP36786.1 hypothetical protein MINTMi198_21560 [Mycobacterium intracellulare M.i.198]BCO67577.1 hypothetical protein MINTM007_21880 [Mycobacterium intracellulare]BCO83652.1 hypothetical protein MINTM011_19870 [Mycobacterium paraintracellulare]